MNSSEKEMLTMLESMPLDKARIAIATRQFVAAKIWVH